MIAALVLGIPLLINLIILLLILGLIYWIVSILPVPSIFKLIAQVIIGVVLIIYLLSFLTGCEGLHASYHGEYGNVDFQGPTATPAATPPQDFSK
jgi:hypothetical protein